MSQSVRASVYCQDLLFPDRLQTTVCVCVYYVSLISAARRACVCVCVIFLGLQLTVDP